MLADKPTELSRIKLKTWTRQPVPMISEHSVHLAPLSVDFRTWLWRYTCLLLISRLWHRKRYSKRKKTSCVPLLNAGFEPGAPDTNSPADWMLADSWLSHLALAIYMLVVVNFDALTQGSDIQIERRQVVFLCWMQDLNPGPQTPIRQQTECSLTVDFRTWLWRYTC